MNCHHILLFKLWWFASCRWVYKVCILFEETQKQNTLLHLYILFMLFDKSSKYRTCFIKKAFCENEESWFYSAAYVVLFCLDFIWLKNLYWGIICGRKFFSVINLWRYLISSICVFVKFSGKQDLLGAEAKYGIIYKTFFLSN